MPIKHISTSKTTGYWQYGNRTKYYYKSLKEKTIAYHKMLKQVRAIYASKYFNK